MSKKNNKGAKKVARTRGGKKKPAPKAAKKKAPATDHKRLDGIAEHLQLASQAFRADMTALLADVRKNGGKLSAKARKTFGAVAREYRKASKDLKKLSGRKHG